MNKITKISESLFNHEFDQLLKYKELGNQKDGIFYEHNSSHPIHGKQTIFYKGMFGVLNSQKKRAEIDFNYGLIHGTIVFYEKNAEVWLISEFKNGIPDGEFILFCPGEITREHLEISMYKQGECISKEIFPPPSTIRCYTSEYKDFMKKLHLEDKLLDKPNIITFLELKNKNLSSEIEIYKENPLIEKWKTEMKIEEQDRLIDWRDKWIDGIYNKILSNK
ncbi:MAG: hypothetical protein H8E55_61315 [Pelagibacterales bacterium]|nr:hypothetical protein [Pelagibacterales bacterium]